jgi:tight adherence protein C
VAVVSDADITSGVIDGGSGSPGAWLLGLLRAVGEQVRRRTRIFSEQEINDFEKSVAAAGFNPRGFVPALLGTKMVLMVLAPVAAFVICSMTNQETSQTILIVAGAATVGTMGPNWALQMMRRPYVKALQKGIPDALDLMVISTEAGQGLETAVGTVAKEMAFSNRAIAVEFSMLSHELQMLPDRHQAILNLGLRSGSPGLKRLSAILAQTMAYGTPLVQGLRAVASELRRERMIALEAKAARLPALLVLPMILFIMPCLFIVLMGPSVVRLLDALENYGK